jgi:putative peptide zinc metalloprotease protein
MPSALDRHYHVSPHSRVDEGEDVIIGRPATSAYLSVSGDVVAVLDWLGEGRSLAETIALYERRYGDAEGVAETVEALTETGFLRPEDADAGFAARPPAAAAGPDPRTRRHRVLDTAALLYGPVGLTLQALVIAGAAFVLWRDPQLIPGLRALFFERQVTLTSLAVIALSLGTLAIHELAHMGATWRRGVMPALGVSHRLWMPVAETDLTGLWSLPRRQRFLPILAGPLADTVSSAAVVLVLFARRSGWLDYGDLVETALEAILVIGALRILWQCLLFVRTDFYYALAHLFRCRNLMADTEAYLAGLVRWLVSSAPAPDLSQLPHHERLAVRSYGGLWLAGRLLAFGFLFVVQIPLLFHFVGLFVRSVAAAGGSDPYRVADTLVMALFVLLTNGLGFGLWIHNLLRRRTPDAPFSPSKPG